MLQWTSQLLSSDNASESICYPLKSLGKAPEIHLSLYLQVLLLGEEIPKGDSFPFPLLNPSAKILYSWGWTSFSSWRGFSHPKTSGKLSSGDAFYLWSLKHSSVPVLKTNSKNKCIQVQMSETDRSEGLYSHYRKCFVSFFFFPFLS